MGSILQKNIVVMKFGGTSVANIEAMQNVANIVARYTHKGINAVVIVSAMAGHTNKLAELWKQISWQTNSREYDKLMATGEIITATLITEILKNKGLNAKSFSGMEAGIATNKKHGNAEIIQLDPTNIRKQLSERGSVAVVAGFQGFIRNSGDTTTLGRGGSDTSAVAMAKALKLNKCIIFTDVDGVYGVDPNIHPEAKRIPLISHVEMLEFAKAGAKVLHEKSVETARKGNIDIHVLSTNETINNNNSNEQGTVVTSNQYKIYDRKSKVVGVAVGENYNRCMLKLRGADKNITDILKENLKGNLILGDDEIIFNIYKNEDEKISEILNSYASKTAITMDKNLSKVTIIGNFAHHQDAHLVTPAGGVVAQAQSVLRSNAIDHTVETISESCIIIAVDSNYKELAARVMYTELVANAN